MLHAGYADSLGWFQQEGDAFESEEVKQFVASVGVYNHDQYSDLTKRGKKLNTDRLTRAGLLRRIKNVRVREKWQAMWNKIFKSKKAAGKTANDN